MSLPYSASLLDRLESSTPKEFAAGSDPAAAAPPAGVGVARSLPAVSEAEAYRGLIALTPERRRTIDRAVADDAALTELLQTGISPDDLAALVVLRSPSVRAAREQWEAARTSYQQSADLEDLVGIYQAFTTDTMTRVGPNRSTRPTAMIAPTPNVSALSAEVAQRTTEIAFQAVRASTRDAVARAWEVHADAVRLAEARRILREEVELDQVLLRIQRSNLESGTGSQAGYLAFESRLSRLTTELSILDLRETVVRAQWNSLLSRPEGAPIQLDIESALPSWAPADSGESVLFQTAEAARPDVLSATRMSERAEVALRLAETMTLPRFDVGTSRLEPGQGFPEPGVLMQPRADFGIREAQVQELRARAESAKAAERSLRDRAQVETRTALFAAESAQRRLDVHTLEVVPLARDSLDAARGAYEGNRATYLDLLDATQRLLDARLGLADARRDLGHAFAGLIRAVGVAPWNGPQTNGPPTNGAGTKGV